MHPLLRWDLTLGQSGCLWQWSSASVLLLLHLLQLGQASLAAFVAGVATRGVARPREAGPSPRAVPGPSSLDPEC